jgi:hypothetical protein
VQAGNALTGMHPRSVAKIKRFDRAIDVEAKNASRMSGIFEHRLTATQPTIKQADSVREPASAGPPLRCPFCGIPHRHLAGLRLPQPCQQPSVPEKVAGSTQYNRICAGHARPKVGGVWTRLPV